MNDSIKRERQLAGPWPDWPCRLLACGKAGKLPAKLTAHTRVIVPHKRERQLAAPRRELARAATHPYFFKKRLTFPAGAPSNE